MRLKQYVYQLLLQFCLLITIKYIYRQLYDYPVSQTFGAQTEFDQELFSNPGTGASAGTDASTQVDEKDVSSSSPDRGLGKKNLIA